MDKKRDELDLDLESLGEKMQAKVAELKDLTERQKIILEYKAAVNIRLVDFAKNYADGKNKEDNKSTFVVGTVNERAVAEIKKISDCDVSGYYHVIKPNTIRHIEKRHGESGKQDMSMSELEDIGRIGYVLENFDKVQLEKSVTYGFKNGQNLPASILRYEKRINGSYIIAEALTDTKAGHLQIISAFKIKAQEQKKQSDNLME